MKIPVYESKLSVQPTLMDPSKAALVGKEIVDVSKGIEGLALQVDKMNSKRQSFKAEEYLANAHNENWKMVSSDPDLDNLEEKLDKQSNNQIQDAAKMIQDPDARNTFVEKATLDMDRRSVSLYHTIAHRQSVDFKDSMVRANDADISDIMKLSDPAERALSRQKIIDRVNGAKEDGHVHPEWADHYLKTTLKDVDIKQVGADIDLHAEGTLKELEKGKDGAYSYLSQDEHDYFTKRAEQKILKQEKEKKRDIKNLWDNNAHDLQMKWNAGSLKEPDVEALGATGQISPATHSKYMKNLGDPRTVNASTDADTYLNLISYVSDPNISTDKKRHAIIDANTEGMLDKNDAAKIYNMPIFPSGGGYTSMGKVVGDKSEEQDLQKLHGGFIQSGIDMIKRLVPGSAARQANTAKMFIEGIKRDMPPDTISGMAYSAVKKQRIMDKPEITSYPEEGQMLMDDDGRTGTAYPDGSLSGDNEQGAEAPGGY